MTSSIIVSKPTSRDGEFSLTFPQQIELTGEEQIGLQNISLYYSWDNITAKFNNNKFVYIHDLITYTIDIPDGYYQISDLNAYVQLAMKTQGHYLVNQLGKDVFYFKIQTNIIYYVNTISLTTVPSSLPAGWTNPASFSLTGETFRLVISDNISKILGLTPSTYPPIPSALDVIFNSDKTPEITPISFVYVKCDFVNDTRFSFENSDVISQIIVTDTRRGTLFNLNPQTVTFLPVKGGKYSRINITLTDQTGLPLAIRDKTAVLISLLLKR